MECTIEIPKGAAGKVGMVVALNQVNGLPEGRLGVVRHPIGWVQALLKSHHPVFAWQVFLLGEAIVVDGRPTQEIVVADRCLRRVSQLAVSEMGQLVDEHEQQQVQEAAQQARELVGDDAMDSPEFERKLHLACSEAVVNFANEVVGWMRLCEPWDLRQRALSQPMSLNGWWRFKA